MSTAITVLDIVAGFFDDTSSLAGAEGATALAPVGDLVSGILRTVSRGLLAGSILS